MEDDGDRIGDDFGGDQGHAEEEDLEGLRCVSLSEAFVIMEERQKVSPVAEKNAEMFRLYKKYTEEFQKFRNSMTLKQLRDRLVNYEISADGRKLNDYEAAMLMNLIPRTAQEAIEMLPQLKRCDEAKIAEIVKHLEKSQHSQE